jgi:hypothetical protein
MKNKTNYDFPVELRPVFTTSNKTKIEMPRKLAVVRTDTDTSLGIVSDKYAFLKHADVISGFREALSGQKYSEDISLQRDGAQLFVKYTLKDVQAEVQKGDIVGMQLIARNSYDGSTQLHLSLGSLRLVCGNGMVVTKSFIEFSHKHVGETLALNVGDVKQSIDGMIAKFQTVLPFMQNMSRTTLAKDDTELFDAKKLKLPGYLVEEAKQEYTRAKDNTLWGYYNSLTFAITHKMRKDAPALESYYSALAWDIASKEFQHAVV